MSDEPESHPSSEGYSCSIDKPECISRKQPVSLPVSSLLGDRLMIDRSVAFAVALRIWQFLAGGVSLWFVAQFFSPELQGFYYMFSSLLGIQTFFDLGLTGVLMFVASHEWAAARDESHAASRTARQRLGELVIRSRRWYALCGVAFAGTAAGVGTWFFSGTDVENVHWLLPWLWAIALTSFSFWLSPSIGILEGCNYVATVNAYRLAQAVVGNFAVWTVILLGGGLWAVVTSAAVRLGMELLLVQHRFRPFLASLVSAGSPGPPLLSWQRELLPLQWRIAVQSIAAWFALQAYTPIIFKYHGAVVGGQMGMTWTAITTIQLAAYAWIQTRIPQMGRLISEGRLKESRRFLRRVLSVSMGVYLLAAAAFWLLIVLLGWYWPSLAARVLDPTTVLLFEIGMGLTLVVYGLGVYVRAHKIDPFLRIGVSTSLLTGLLVWWLGAEVGPRGAALAHIGVTGLLLLPACVIIYRRTGGQT